MRLPETTMTRARRSFGKLFAAAGLSAACVLGVVGCGDDNSGGAPDFAMNKPPDMSMNVTPDFAGVDLTGVDLTQMQQQMPDMGCYGNPMTHIEIINACTTSKQLDKPTNPNLPFLDGGLLPPLP
jgi:hypothetical protein